MKYLENGLYMLEFYWRSYGCDGPPEWILNHTNVYFYGPEYTFSIAPTITLFDPGLCNVWISQDFQAETVGIYGSSLVTSESQLIPKATNGFTYCKIEPLNYTEASAHYILENSFVIPMRLVSAYLVSRAI